jgi:hypothetical protein
MLQVRRSEIAPVHADDGVELAVVQRGSLAFLVSDLGDDRADHSADHGTSRGPNCPCD